MAPLRHLKRLNSYRHRIATSDLHQYRRSSHMRLVLESLTSNQHCPLPAHCDDILPPPCLYRKSDSAIKSSEDGRRYDAAHVLDGAMYWSVLVERAMRPQLVIVDGAQPDASRWHTSLESGVSALRPRQQHGRCTRAGSIRSAFRRSRSGKPSLAAIGLSRMPMARTPAGPDSNSPWRKNSVAGHRRSDRARRFGHDRCFQKNDGRMRGVCAWSTFCAMCTSLSWNSRTRIFTMCATLVAHTAR